MVQIQLRGCHRWRASAIAIVKRLPGDLMTLTTEDSEERRRKMLITSILKSLA